MLWAALKRRSVLRLSGSDVEKVVHNVTTREGPGFCHLLSPQGRTLVDAFVVRVAEKELLLEMGSSVEENVRKHLKLFSFRLDLQIKTETQFPHVVHVSGARPWLGDQGPGLVIPDSRMPDAWRVYTLDETWFGSRGLLSNPSLYETRRILNGVAEGPEEIPYNKAIPLEFNLDRQGGVMFDKGCYLGQELVARTHTVGVVRKRLTPVWLSAVPPPANFTSGPGVAEKDVLDFLESGSLGEAIRPRTFSSGSKEGEEEEGGMYDQIQTSKGKSCGKVVLVSSQFPSLGLAMLRQQYVGSENAGSERLSLQGVPCWPLVIRRTD